MEWKYINYNDLLTEIKTNPNEYTVWFKKIVERVNQHLSNPKKVLHNDKLH
jgi:isopentenyl-diphosphate delta-isomerase